MSELCILKVGNFLLETFINLLILFHLVGQGHHLRLLVEERLIFLL